MSKPRRLTNAVVRWTLPASTSDTAAEGKTRALGSCSAVSGMLRTTDAVSHVGNPVTRWEPLESTDFDERRQARQQEPDRAILQGNGGGVRLLGRVLYGPFTASSQGPCKWRALGTQHG